MAQLKSTIISGSLRATDTIYANNLQSLTFNTYSSSAKTTYGAGTNGQVLCSDGTNTYWGNLSASNISGMDNYLLKTGGALTGTVTNSSYIISASSGGVYNTSGDVIFYFFKNNSVVDASRMASIVLKTVSLNNTIRPSRFIFRQYSYNSSTAAASTNWDQYFLPEVTADKTNRNDYDILTTKNTVTVAQGGTGQTSIANIQAGKDGDGNIISSTYLKLSTVTTQGDLLYASGNGAITRLAAGTSGYLLQTNGSTAAPSWVQATDSATASTIVKRNSSGKINLVQLYFTGSTFPQLQFWNADSSTRWGSISSFYGTSDNGYIQFGAGSVATNKKYSDLTLKSDGTANGLQYYVYVNNNGTATENTYTVLNTGNISTYITTYTYSITWGSTYSANIGNANTFATTDTLIIGPGATTNSTVHNAIIKAQFEFEVTTNNGNTQLVAYAMGTKPAENTVIPFIVLKCNT